MGPNMKKLVAHKISLDAFPPGTGGDFHENLMRGIDFIRDPKGFVASVKPAQDWAKAAVQAVRNAAEPNEWKTADDEAIAGEILKRVDERKKKR